VNPEQKHVPNSTTNPQCQPNDDTMFAYTTLIERKTMQKSH